MERLWSITRINIYYVLLRLCLLILQDTITPCRNTMVSRRGLPWLESCEGWCFRLSSAQDCLLCVRREVGPGQAGPAGPPAISYLTSWLHPGQSRTGQSSLSPLTSHISHPLTSHLNIKFWLEILFCLLTNSLWVNSIFSLFVHFNQHQSQQNPKAH